MITRFASLEDFTLGNFDITTDGATEYVHAEASALKLNVKATVEGHLKEGKVLADKITWLSGPDWKIQAPITDMRNMSRSGGEILVQDTWLTLTPSARLDSEFSKDGDRMKYGDLRLNDFVVITGHQEGDQLIVDSLEREEKPQLAVEKKILGFVQPYPLSTDASAFWLNTQLLVYMEDNTQFFDNGKAITKLQFVQKAPGQYVTVFGVMVDDGSYRSFKATSIRLASMPMPMPIPSWPGFGPAPLPPLQPMQPADNNKNSKLHTTAERPRTLIPRY